MNLGKTARYGLLCILLAWISLAMTGFRFAIAAVVRIALFKPGTYYIAGA